MGIHETKYKTENGKTRKVKKEKDAPSKGASKEGAPNLVPGADGKNNKPGV
jgi:hypothetical protein